MKIALDITPLKDERRSQYNVRGGGIYIAELKRAIEQFDKENQYTFFTRGEKLPEDVDLVHYPYFEPFFLSLPLGKPLPSVVTIHDLIPLVFPTHFPAGIKGKLKWQVQKKSLLGCRAIMTDSQNSKRDIVKITGFPEKNVDVVYLAPSESFRQLNDGLVPEGLKAKYRLPEKFILYVGDVTWNKNLPRLIEATKNINVPLVMVGKALAENDFDKSNLWDQDWVKVQQVSDKEKRIIRLGFVPQGDLVGLYNLAICLVMPSLYEGFGLPVLEAMACGCPVVSGSASSLPEIAGEAAVFVDPQNVASIKEGIEKVVALENQDKTGYGKLQQKGLAWVKRFSWEKTVKETVAVYQKVLRS